MSRHVDLIASSGRGPLFWMLVALIATFVAARLVTRSIRSGALNIPNWEIGGLHIHHAVFGVLALLTAGYLEFSYQPRNYWADVLSGLFGIGAGLTLDEFALWLHLDDVYWLPEGRASIDAVFTAASIAALMLVGFKPFAFAAIIDAAQPILLVATLVNLVLVVITVLKGKHVTGILGLVVPFIALIGAIRLAKPASVWARRRYSSDSSKLAAARRRFDPGGSARWNRLRDVVGGRPLDEHGQSARATV